ncbi:transglutaminase-like domain-containing protein [Pelagicoccus mobilis]|nr:DUF3857 domain-containing protein [Pelagicoccus mobilis]
MMLRALIAIVSVGLAGSALAKSSYPDWLEECLENKSVIDRFEEEADALCLLDESEIEYEGRGVVSQKVRRAFHIYDRDGRENARIAIQMSDGRKLDGFSAWIIYKSGKIERYKKNDLVEIALDRDKLRSDSYQLQLDRSESMREETVFAFEYETSKKTVFLDGAWRFNMGVPVVLSRLSLTLRKGWELRSSVFNSDFSEYSNEGYVHRWEGRNIPAVEIEESQPFSSLMTGNLYYTVHPDSKEMSRYPYAIFSNWNDVARYVDASQDERILTNEALVAKTEEITAGKESQWEKISEICSYAQSINYLANSIDLYNGGGMTPQFAEETFEKHYGDCKDMTALARAMLSCIGIESFAVTAQIGSDSWVYDEWASPAAFNHCILGVRVSDDAPDCSGVFEHPKHGRMLIFDPTTKNSSPGVLPYYLKGRKILVCSEKDDALLALPEMLPEENRVKREVTATINLGGNLNAELVQECYGGAAESLRGLYRSLKRDDFESFLRAWIANGTRDAQIDSWSCEDFFEENRFELTLSFTARRYGRLMNQGEMMLFSPVLMSRLQWVPPVDDDRKTPYLLSPHRTEETIRISIPENYMLDSSSNRKELESEFGRYSMNVSFTDGVLEADRLSVLERSVVPVENYGQLVDYFEQKSRAESSKVVFKQKG